MLSAETKLAHARKRYALLPDNSHGGTDLFAIVDGDKIFCANDYSTTRGLLVLYR
jgi:hypothetical protein